VRRADYQGEQGNDFTEYACSCMLLLSFFAILFLTTGQCGPCRAFVFDDLILVNLLPSLISLSRHEQHENRSGRSRRRVVGSFSSFWRDSDTSFARNQLGRRTIPKQAALASLGLQMG
jgi:hypothetical protein